MHWHDPEVIIPFLILWTGFLLGGFRYVVARYMSGIEAKLEQVMEHERKLAVLETALNQRPQCSQHAEHMLNIKALHTRMDSINSTVSKVDGRLEGIGRAVDLMNQFLIEQGAQK